MTQEAEVFINGILTPSRPSGGSDPSAEQIALLDDVPSVRDVPGMLAVQVRNLDPHSELSAALMAGELVGPQIDSFSIKPKNKGFNLNLTGRDFHPFATIEITKGDQNVRLKKAIVESDSLALVKVRDSSVVPGTRLSVRVVNLNNVASNEVGFVAP